MVSETSLGFNVATKDQVTLTLRKEMMTQRGTLLKKFEGYFMVSLFSQIHKSYLARSKGGSDKYDNFWKPLKKSTIRKKAKKRGKRGAALINVDSGRSIDSYKPGKVSRSGYVPHNNDQLFTLKGLTIRLGSKVEYLKFADNRRPILIGSSVNKMVDKAIKVALSKLTKDMRRSLKSKGF